MENHDLIRVINANFLIRWQEKSNKNTHLVGAGQYHKIVGCEKLAKKHFKRALKSTRDKCTIKLRSRLRIDFVVK